MFVRFLKRLAAQLPQPLQHELRRFYFRRQIRANRFFTSEKEYGLLPKLLTPGDWVLDIGANVGHYTKRMSELVGPTGRVIAFEPVPDTFALLTANARLFAHANVSLLNVAASDCAGAVGMRIPDFSEGLKNYYQASIASDAAELIAFTLPVDALGLPATIQLVKIDVEGHEMAVLRGMRQLLTRDRPVLILETASHEAVELLNAWDYMTERLPGSSNLLCKPQASMKQGSRIA
jgi:FkbM family methyltransferase